MTSTLLLLLGLLIGLGLGAVVGWLLKDARSRGAISIAQLRAEQAESEARRFSEEATKGREEVVNLREEARNEQRQLAEVDVYKRQPPEPREFLSYVRLGARNGAACASKALRRRRRRQSENHRVLWPRGKTAHGLHG